MQKEEIIEEMKRRGKRITEQRKILLDIVLKNPHNCCKEIYYEAVKKDPSIGIATVYRMLNMLEEIGSSQPFLQLSGVPESGASGIRGGGNIHTERQGADLEGKRDPVRGIKGAFGGKGYPQERRTEICGYDRDMCIESI